jgi:hypothetical protein
MVRTTFLVSLSLLLLTCENIPDYPSGQGDLIEMESVWQYLKAYSIHQDECASGSGSACVKKLRDNPFSYNSPEEMMSLLFDTLGGHSYTKYCDDCGEAIAQNSSVIRTHAYGVDETSAAYQYVKLVQVTDSTALIKISTEFVTGVSYKQFLEVLPNIKGNCRNLIIDVCGNRGGDLDELDSILELFLPENTSYILARERAYDSTSKQYKTIDFRPLKTMRPMSPYLKDKKIIVLMDSGSASAAEILASALKDGYGAQLVGQRSYGKAIGQIKLPRRGRKWLQITFLQLESISAGKYQNIGLKPDITIANLNIYQSRDQLLGIVRLLEPEAKLSDLKLPSSLQKARAPLLPEGYIIRDVEIVPD